MLAVALMLMRNAWHSIRKFPVQSALSILAIAIGAAAIILVGNLSLSMQKSAATFEARENKLSVVIRVDATFDEILTGTGAELQVEHGPLVKRAFVVIEQVIPILTLGTRSRKIGIAQKEFDAHVFGTSSNWAKVTANDMSVGRFIAVADDINRSDVCVVGFAYGAIPNIIGSFVRMGDYQCRVIGVLARRGRLLVNYDEVIVLPLSVAQSLARQKEGGDIELIVSPVQGATLDAILPQLRTKVRALLARTPKQGDGFLLIDAQGVKQFIADSLGKATAVLTGLIAIAMLVAGLGVFSLMLTGVVTRTSEIGIRRAVGATSLDIALQFLSESALISLFGGLFGVILALTMTLAISIFSDVLSEIAVSWSAVGIAIISSSLIGVLFGFWPALRAARLDPVAALAYE